MTSLDPEPDRTWLKILGAIPAWLLVVDRQGHVRFANPSFLAAASLTLDEARQRSVAELLPMEPEEESEFQEALRQVASNAAPLAIQSVSVGGAARARRVMDVQITPFGEAGEVSLLLILHDVSQHRWSLETILREKQKLQEIVDGMGAALAVLDPALRVIWSNRTFRRWFGKQLGRRFELALHGLPGDPSTPLDELLAARELISDIYPHLCESGEQRFHRNIIIPERDEEGRLREVIVVTTDMTEVTLRAQQHRLLGQLNSLLQSTLELDRLLYIVLTCVTAGHALGLNRAYIFLVDEERQVLQGHLGVGPASIEEAHSVWDELARSQLTLAQLTEDESAFQRAWTHPLAEQARKVSYPLSEARASSEILVRTVLEGRSQLVREDHGDYRGTRRLRRQLGIGEFVTVPLRGKGRVLGAILADNAFTGRRISPEQAQLLELFASGTGLAIDNALAYEALRANIRRLEQAQAALIQSEQLAAIGRMAAHVAHEIRNPLATIGGHARSILKHVERQEYVQESAEIIYEEVTRLEHILSGVIDFSRPILHKPTRDSLNAVVQRVAQTMRSELAAKGVTLTVELAPELPTCLLDRERLHQAIMNLMLNGVEAMQAGGCSEPCLLLRTSRAGDRLLLEVSDNGPGIPPELAGRIFEPFVSGRAFGTGLGLAMVHKVMHDHGGEVTVASPPGVGATFSLWLPTSTGKPEEQGAEH